MFWEAINIGYSLHVEVSNLTVLDDFDYFKAKNSLHLGNWPYDYLNKNWATLKLLAAGKKANLLRFGALKCLQHCNLLDCAIFLMWATNFLDL